ncbi:MAG TPA: hypothetical protein ENG51_22285 [Deltaproteobacteria bacterium]|nr:hypothetical protein [Deltaproteobacteria bacterium]
MTLEELYKYAYVKRPLNEVYKDPSMVPEEFILEWYKDAYDYQRPHSEEELAEFVRLTPQQILEWLEEVVEFVWEASKHWKASQLSSILSPHFYLPASVES